MPRLASYRLGGGTTRAGAWSRLRQRGLERTSMCKLIRRLVLGGAKEERRRFSWAWQLPGIRWLRDWTIGRLGGELDRIHNELARRFRGLFAQVLKNVSQCLPPPGFLESQREAFFAGLELRMRVEMKLLDDPRRFVPRLWDAVISQLTIQGQDVGGIQKLKPRFMLFQFVYEVGRRKARRVLLNAFADKYDQGPDASELIQLRKAYYDLHRVLRKQGKVSLGLMTGESISLEGVSPGQFQRWLYPP